MVIEIEFRECPRCHGYGVLDSGHNCKECGGVGTGGLRTANGVIGSGEIMYEKGTRRRITVSELLEIRESERVQTSAIEKKEDSNGD